MSQSGSYSQNGGGGGPLKTLEGNDGGKVFPSAGNIRVLGDGAGFNVVGNSSTNTLTVSTNIVWGVQRTTSPSITLSPFIKYILGTTTQIIISLPTSSSPGDMFWIVGAGVITWKIQQTSSQAVTVGLLTTTTGSSGSVTSVGRNCCLQLVTAITPGQTFISTGMVRGNLSIV